MGISGPESLSSSVGNQISRGSESDFSNCNQDELEHLRVAKKQTEIKLQMLRKRYEDEASLFTDTRVDHIFKINGARDYLEKLNEKTRIKDDIIRNLKEDLEFKSQELKLQQDRCREAEKRCREYQKLWRESQTATTRDRQPDSMEKKTSNSIVRDTTARILNRSTNMSSASSFTESPVPPPPQVDVPTIDEMLRSTPTPRDQLDANMSLDSSIPPPPDIDVPLDELIQQNTSTGERVFNLIQQDTITDKKPSELLQNTRSDTKAFVYEQGQFLCHVYAPVELAASKETLGDIVELVEAEQDRSRSRAYQDWSANLLGSDEGDGSNVSRFHVTLIRGHRAIYYHQISELLNCIETGCNSSGSFRLCLDKLMLFSNYESTKQFLCIAGRDNSAQSSSDYAQFKTLKTKLRDVIDQFATRLTQEDETEDTLAHCSLMCREISQAQPEEVVQADLEEIERLCEESLDDYPMCMVKVDKINVKIGNRVYEYNLAH